MPIDIDKIRDQIRLQPAWRKESGICDDYYHGKQISADVAQELAERGQANIVVNVIKPTINALLGMEAKQRTDWRVYTDSDEQQEIAEALSVKLAEAERESRADNAISEAYAMQVKAGVGWVEVGRAYDPFAYPYRVESVSYREIHWDWTARKSDLSDANWMVRERWYPVKAVCEYFPEHAELIKAAGSGWDSSWRDIAMTSENLQGAFDRERRSTWMDDEWRNTEAGMIMMREVWYRTYKRGTVITLPTGRVVAFDQKNEAHMLAVMAGMAQPREAVLPTVSVAIWVGPHMLQDVETHTRRFPYVPFWGYREDGTGVPYGAIRDMIPMQDEVNARRRKLLWLLSSKRVIADSDALDHQYNDFTDLVREVSRPDSVVVTNPNRVNANAIRVETDVNLASQQFEVMQDAEDAVQRVAGIYNAMMGRSDKATSGTAINSLVEQGTNSVADINDNYRFARATVGELLLDLLIEDLGQQNSITVVVDRKKTIVLNDPTYDPASGYQYRNNDITRISLKVSLSDVPSTPAYRQQQMVQIGEVLKSLPPQIQAVMVPFYLEATDLPKREEMADLVRKQLGIADDEQPQIPPELQQQIEQGMMMIEQLQMQNQELMGQVQQTTQALEVAKRGEEMKAAELQAKAEAELRTYSLEATRQQLERDRFEFEKLRQAAEMKLKAKDQTPQIKAEMQQVEMKMADAIKQIELKIAERKQEESAKPEPTQAPTAAPTPPQPITMNIQIDAKQGTVKKEIKVERDKDGNITGATATEEADE